MILHNALFPNVYVVNRILKKRTGNNEWTALDLTIPRSLIILAEGWTSIIASLAVLYLHHNL